MSAILTTSPGGKRELRGILHAYNMCLLLTSSLLPTLSYPYHTLVPNHRSKQHLKFSRRESPHQLQTRFNHLAAKESKRPPMISLSRSINRNGDDITMSSLPPPFPLTFITQWFRRHYSVLLLVDVSLPRVAGKRVGKHQRVWVFRFFTGTANVGG